MSLGTKVGVGPGDTVLDGDVNRDADNEMRAITTTATRPTNFAVLFLGSIQSPGPLLTVLTSAMYIGTLTAISCV